MFAAREKTKKSGRVLLKSVYKSFGDNEVVSDLNLEIKDGEFMVLVGPSGCGKTTTLRMIAGLEEISDGDIYIGDRLVNNVLPKDRDIAMVFQNYALYPHFTVYENMAFGLKLRRIPKKEIAERVAVASEILGLEKLLERKPKQLSGGQRQRVALGRAIVRQPAVFLMDEPLSNLDAKLRVQTRGQLKKLHATLKTTIIYVTHDQVEAMTLGNRIAIMKDGVLQQCDEPMKVYRQPDNKFVAGFIGSPAMNFVEGLVSQAQDKFYFEGQNFKVELPAGLTDELSECCRAGRRVILGIRPENIWDVRRNKETQGMPQMAPLAAAVDFCEILGSETFVHLKAGDDALVAKASPLINLESGDKIAVMFDLRQVHLFDKETTKTII